MGMSCWYLVLLSSGISLIRYRHHVGMSCRDLILLLSAINVTSYRHHLGINVDMYHFHRVLLMLLSLFQNINITWISHVDTSYYFYRLSKWMGITYPAIFSLWPGIDITWVCHLDTSYCFRRISIWSAIGITWVCHVGTSYYFYRLQCDWLSTKLGYQCWLVPLSPGTTHVVITFPGYEYHLGMSCWYPILLLSAINVIGYHIPCTSCPGIHITWVCHLDTSYYFHWVSIWPDIDSTWVCHVDTSYYFYRLSMWPAIDITWVSILTCTTFTGYHIPHIIFQFDRVLMCGYRHHLGMSCWYHITFIDHSTAWWLEYVISTWSSAYPAKCTPLIVSVVETYLRRSVHDWKIRWGILFPYMGGRIIYGLVLHHLLRRSTIAQIDMYFASFNILDTRRLCVSLLRRGRMYCLNLWE
jgi:hypothetical protein